MIGTKQILAYTFLPQVRPRLNNFLHAGFSNLAVFMALAYRGVRLLPENHPYLSTNQSGNFGVFDVLREASKGLNFSIKNIDQIIVFFSLLAGIIILAFQFVILLMSLFIGTASAAGLPANIGQFFVTTNRNQDIALRLLDKVFGVPNIFGTQELQAGVISPFHRALHELFQFYSIGLLVIAAIIIAYYIFAIVAETAQTGTPFGKRYNHVWAPLRLVAAIGLLIPIGMGLNAAQWITLYAAKFGSGFATNGWIEFNNTMSQALIDGNELVATPNAPELKDVVAFIHLVRSCREAYMDVVPNRPSSLRIRQMSNALGNTLTTAQANALRNNPQQLAQLIQNYNAQINAQHQAAVQQAIANGTPPPPPPQNIAPNIRRPSTGANGYVRDIRGYIVDPQNTVGPFPLNAVIDPWSDAWLTRQKQIHIRFGVHDAARYPDEVSNVYPYCGEIVVQNNVPVTDSPQSQLTSGSDQILNAAQVMTWSYLGLVQGLYGVGPDAAMLQGTILQEAQNMMDSRVRDNPKNDPDGTFQQTHIDRAVNYINISINTAAIALQNTYQQPTQIAALGWGGAAIWYNRIANVNGLLTSAVMNKPTVSLLPSVMEYTCKENRQQNSETSQVECYDPRLTEGREAQFATEEDPEIATALSDVFDFWYKDPEDVSGNIFVDTINLFMGTQGLFDMCRNANIHPLAQLSATGKGLVEAAIRNLAVAGGLGGTSLFAGYFGPSLQAASGFFVSIASVGILIGFILYYIIPFMPFLYFLFAVGGWVKGLFEAMVGVPLWALAHLRIDGQGLAGDGAINGYFLIFEIFIRPILIIFGLLAAIVIFAAMVKVLNETFSLVVSNLSGFSTANSSQCGTAFQNVTGSPTGSIDFMRGPVDEFFFTIVYAILVYMIGMASFKLIDLIPNQILRWMGAGVSTFNDNAGEPAEGLVSKLAIGGGIMGSQLSGAVQGAAGAGGALAQGATKLLK